MAADSDSDSDLDLTDPPVRETVREAIIRALGGDHTTYPVTREDAETWHALAGRLRLVTRDLRKLDGGLAEHRRELAAELKRLDAVIADLAERKRIALYGGHGHTGIAPRLDALEERVGKPESLSSQVTKVAAFVAAAGGAAAAVVAVAKALG